MCRNGTGNNFTYVWKCLMRIMSVEKPINNNYFNSGSHEKLHFHKRTRYEKGTSSTSNWSLAKNELILHSVYDLGVSRLESDSDNDEVETHIGDDGFCNSIVCKYPEYTPYTKSKETAVVENSLPDKTFKKLSIGEFDHILISRCTTVLPQVPYSNLFDLLSDEVILFILQKLSKPELRNVALVCRRFHRLTDDESLWTRMDICNKKLDKGAFGRIMSRQVIVLRVARCNITSPPIYGEMKASLPDYHCRLMYLDLSMSTISPDGLCMIFDKCSKLKKLSLENIPINESVLVALSDNKDLEVLNLAMCTGMEKSGVERLLDKCKKIRELNMSWTYLSSECISYICGNLPIILDRFNFSGCRKLLQDKDISHLVTQCPRIRELDLSDCTSITGHSIHHLTLLSDLNFLALSRCYLIPPRSILHLKTLKNLSYLDVHGGYIGNDDLTIIRDGLGMQVNINKFKFSSVARPTVGLKKHSIWNMKLREW